MKKLKNWNNKDREVGANQVGTLNVKRIQNTKKVKVGLFQNVTAPHSV